MEYARDLTVALKLRTQKNMASMKELPKWNEKQKLLAQKNIDQSKLRKLGALAEKYERYQEALEYWVPAEETDRIEALKSVLIEQGDYFLVHWLYLRGFEVTDQNWHDLAEAAEASGKWAHALAAYQKCQNEKKAGIILAKLEKNFVDHQSSGVASQDMHSNPV